MRAWLLGLLLCLCGSLTLAAESVPDEVRLVSEYWAGHTNPDGSGLAWEVLRLAFEPAGVKVRWRNEPYVRAIGLVQRGDADAFLGSYQNEVHQGMLYPRSPYDADLVEALGLASLSAPDLKSLGRYRLIWMRGYGYQQYLPGPLSFQEIERRAGILGMLERGHADFYIDANNEVADVLANSPQPERFRRTLLTRLPLYPGFADTPRGQVLAALYDKRMAELVRNGSLRPIFRRWRQPYPFD